jgi:ATP-dependent DNA helicase RecQ
VDSAYDQLLLQYFGYSSFRGRQREIINHVCGGRHGLVVAPTGSGKSLCYQIPALATREASGLVVVLSPLIALMKDQVDSLCLRGIDAACIHSLLDGAGKRELYRALAEGRYRILYVTPERFRKKEFLEAISKRRVILLAVDEAHCVSEWGHDFRPDYSRVPEIRKHLLDPPTLFLTATATAEVRQDIVAQMGLSKAAVRLFSEGIDRPNLSLEVQHVWNEDEKLVQIERVVERHTGSGIIYVTLIKTLERLSHQLRRRGIEHVVYHGALTARERRELQEDFMTGRANRVLATGAFGMGVDKSDIRYVVHAETPSSLEAYYQEVGRAGRDGLPSECLWLYAQDDLLTQMQFIGWRNPDADFFVRTYHYLTEHSESCRAFGLEWLNERLQRVSKHDHRLETALGLLERHGVIAGSEPPACFDVQGDLPDILCDDRRAEAKLRRDQRRLYALVELANLPSEERQEYLRSYFE